ncbi:MAG TPA: GGDEF domain-containing protein [Burkholderiales bacterium]|nr:GGDEF domain-containing protein [Burkholderiales bacterium]
MLASEEKLEKALRSTHTRARDQQQRLRWTAWTASSYALDTLFLALFWQVGTIPASVPLGYGLAGAAVCGTVFAVLASGRNLRLRDPNLGVPQIGAAVLLQLAVVAVAPQLAFPFLANLFTVFAFGMTWAPVRQAAVVWSLGVLALGALFYAMGERLALPVATAAERWLVWSYFSLILGRCLMLSVQASELRQRLQDSRRKLSDSLAQVQQLASHDELTRTLNRRALMARLDEQRSRADRFHEAFCVALLDLDHFKAVNDTHGHAAGDAVLRAFAALAQAGLRDSDVFGRYGGEEFMLILGATPLSAVQPPLERIRTELAGRDWAAVAEGLRVTVSIGVAAYRRGETLEQVLSRADDALYEAKRLGRDRVVARS